MTTKPKTPQNIDAYIAGFPKHASLILEKIRMTIHKAAPAAEDTISYQIPAFTFKGPLVYFAAFKNHIGFYPPVTAADEKLKNEISVYEGPRGNLKFPLDKAIP